MKKIILIIVIALIAIGGYRMLRSSPAGNQGIRNSTLSSEAALRLSSSLDSYEALIAGYEKSGLSDQSRMLQFVADMQQWGTTWSGDMTGLTESEMNSIKARLTSLQQRQMKLLGR